MQVATPPTASEFQGGIIGVTLRPVSGADLISPIIALATWVDEDQSDDQFLFIRNHSSKNPDYAVLTFLVLFPHPDPSDLPDRSLDVISAVTPCHVPQTVTSDVPSTLTCYTTVD